MDSKEMLARLILATTEIADADTPSVPAGLAERTAAIAADLPVVRRLLGPSYTVVPSIQMSAIRCTSRTGMQDDNDAAWAPVMAAFRQHFGARLLEVDANVCYRHTDFTIYLAPTPNS
jgi:hypothetical protein